ncbi:dienelactone hydrolase family protein [Metabacillus sp. KIGAM252]|uniref:Dienelactone hydrolase family protein n=1 Tax=Metabacillus flavus TaxID=2823519 RepID=A0ABS5LC23_9BACI|nr:dienelactone hydrolase family protein [Metabacillus flavus]MBS2968073.1 dienelactone hydrolase family protein [Metabacillus flavus]
MFHDTEKKLISLFVQKEWDEAYALILQDEPNHPGKLHKFSFWKACLLCIKNEPDEAMATLQSAFDKGFWWNPDLLMGDQDLSPLQGRKAFEELIYECEHRKKQAINEARPLVEFHGNQDPSTAVVVLHGRGGNMEDTIPYWINEMSVRDCLFAFLQSSQAAGYDAYGWDDHEQTASEIKAIVSKIIKDYPDVERVILAGFSQGGKTAIKHVLSGELERTKEFYAVVPAIREEDLHINGESDTSGWIVTGTEDPFYEDTKKMKQYLDKKKITCEWIEYEEMAHTYPENFPELFQKSIQSKKVTR